MTLDLICKSVYQSVFSKSKPFLASQEKLYMLVCNHHVFPILPWPVTALYAHTASQTIITLKILLCYKTWLIVIKHVCMLPFKVFLLQETGNIHSTFLSSGRQRANLHISLFFSAVWWISVLTGDCSSFSSATLASPSFFLICWISNMDHNSYCK